MSNLSTVAGLALLLLLLHPPLSDRYSPGRSFPSSSQGEDGLLGTRGVQGVPKDTMTDDGTRKGSLTSNAKSSAQPWESIL